jgi:uncharacterized protein YabE (DUF348 family)
MASTITKSNYLVNIPSKFDYLHSIYGKAKYAFLAIFALTIMFSAFVSHVAYGDSVVGTVQTKITLKIDGKTRSIDTTQNTIEGALLQNDIKLSQNDITEPALNTYLTGKSLDVQVVRALPVLISDNNQSWSGVSAYSQPMEILNQLKVEVFPEDKVSVELILDPATEGAVGQKVMIQRAPVYTIYVDDATKVVRSWSGTVGEMLAEKGITLGVNDIVEPPKTASLAGISEITITRINYADVEETVPIPFVSIEQKDYNLYQGKSAIVQAGSNGTKKQNIHIVYKNGVEVDRTVTSSQVVEAPTNRITSIGVKPYSHADLWNIMLQAQDKYGVDPSAMFSVMICESGGNVQSGNYQGAKYKGLFQWDGSFVSWAATAGVPADYFNPTSQIMATAARVSKNGWSAWGCKP